MIRSLTLVGFLALSLVGCSEDKETLTVYPNGFGKIVINVKISEQTSKMALGFCRTAEDRERTINSSLLSELGKWDGIDAWMDAKAFVDGKRIAFHACGYFGDLNKVRQADSGVVSFSWKKTDSGGCSIHWNKDEANSRPSILDQSDQEAARLESMFPQFQGLRIERAIILPGELSTLKGVTEHKDRAAAWVITEEQLIPFLKKALDLRKRCNSGEIARNQAEMELNENAKPFRLNIEASSSTGPIEAEVEDFRAEFEKAKSSYAGSDLSTKVEQARSKRLNARTR